MTFGFAKTTLSPEAVDEVDRAAEMIREGGYTAIITGHADAKGAAGANQTVALGRAQAVADRMMQRGVDRALLRVEGGGADSPVASNESAGGRAANRRADIELVPVVVPGAEPGR